MKFTRALAVVYANIVLYALCYQMQRPIEPFLVEKLGSGGSKAEAALDFGKVQSFFGTMQTIGSFVFGLMLDRIGAKAGFLIVFLSAFCSYSLLATATSMQALYLSKVPSMFLHAFMVAQMCVSQQTSPEDRAQALGLLVTSYTIGATVGPALGGLIGASGDYYYGARLAAAGSLLSAALTLLYPSDGAPVEGEGKAAAPKPPQPGVLRGLAEVLSNPVVVSVLATKLVSSSCNSVFNAAQPILLKEHFGLREAGMGAFMSAGMACNALSGVFVVGPLTTRFSAGPLILACLLWMSGCYALQTAAFSPDSPALSMLLSVLPVHPSGPWMVVGILGSAAAFTRGAVFTTISTSSVPDHLKGTLLGLEHGMFSMAAIFTPSLGTYLLVQSGIRGVGAACAAVEVVNAAGWRLVALPRLRRAGVAAVVGAKPDSEKRE